MRGGGGEERGGRGWGVLCVVVMKEFRREGVVHDLCAVYIWSAAGWAVWSTTDQKKVCLWVCLLS